MRLTRLLTAAPLFLVGVRLGLYGLLALSFNERRGSTYVTLVYHRLDAHRVAAVSLVIGLMAATASLALRGCRSS